MVYSRIKCPKCDREFGQEKRFRDHLTDVHGIDNHEELYIEVILSGKPTLCGCGCGKPLPWAGWKKGYTSQYHRGHNAVIDSVYHDKERQKEFAKKRKQGHADGKYHVWNVGLTKESDDRIARSAKKISQSLQELYAGGHVSWQAGLTKETDERVARMSGARECRLASGEIKVWNDGLTKETDPRVRAVAEAVSKRYSDREMGNRLKKDEFLERVLKFSDRFVLVSSPDEYKTRRVDKLRFRCTTCDKVQLKSLAMLEESPICFCCNPKGSTGQLEILDFVRSLGVEADGSDRTVIAPKELDVWVPSRRLGIEYDGLYYHSDLVLGDPKHAMKKLEACRHAGVSLLTVYEDEWRDHRDIVEGMIRHRLGVTPNTRDARKLLVKQISSSVARPFFDENHLEGHVRCHVVFGLIDPKTDEILAAISLRSAFHKRYARYYEVARSCCKRDTNVRGWLGRLTTRALKYAVSMGRDGMMTYVDSRIGVGSAYERAGWKLDSVNTGPRFWWTDFHQRFNRFKFKADKAKGMTQAQVAEEAGVYMIHGCPNSRWVIDP